MTEPAGPGGRPGPTPDPLVELDEPVDATRAFWSGLGLPGLFDVHVHFLPPRIQAAVYRVFDAAGPKLGRPWPIRYRYSHEQRVEVLRALGVRRFSTMPYAHKPGVATYLNDWSREFAAGVPEVIASATLYPEDGVADYVAAEIGAGVEVFKMHLQVGEFDLDDPLLDAAWGVLEDAGTPVVVHAGSGPVGNEHTGPASMQRLLRRFPRLCLVVAHLGAPEYAEFLELAETHDRVHLDTTMVFTDFFADAGQDFPAALVPRLGELGLAGRVLLGSDFPTIPYPYLEQLTGLARLDLGEDWLRAVCWHNGVRLFGFGSGNEPAAVPPAADTR